jgi:hypothetical protein
VALLRLGMMGKAPSSLICWHRLKDWSSGLPRLEEAPMELPEDIRREIEKSRDRDIILNVISRLQNDGVKITHDVIAAIVATIAIAEGGAVC